jgi:alpha-mannosidase
MALLNNGRYGHSVSGGVLGISLLRSPVFPDPLADEGSHSFTYSLFSHPHDWFAGGVLAEAEDLNAPLPATIVPSSATGIWQAGLFSGLPLALGAFKAAYDGSGLVLRAYEPAGSAGEARIELCDDWHLTSELNLLEDAIGEPSFRFGKHQVRTWLVTGS